MLRRSSFIIAILGMGVVMWTGCLDSAKLEIAPYPTGGPEDFDFILKKYVVGEYFDYAGLHANPKHQLRLESFLKWQADADLSEMSREEQIAFYVNAYNSSNIKAILDYYPVHSPADIPGFFDRLTFRVAGEDLTINEIEYQRLIPRYRDMRTHFAVVCADRGSFPLRPAIWTGETLDQDLEEVTRRFARDERYFKVDLEKKEVWVSKLLDWYGEDFIRDPLRPARRPELYLVPYLEPAERELLESGDYELKVLDWSWTLNEKLLGSDGAGNGEGKE